MTKPILKIEQIEDLPISKVTDLQTQLTNAGSGVNTVIPYDAGITDWSSTIQAALDLGGNVVLEK